ncbi:Nucleotidyltransferase domain-containing protein [Mucilaginibacter sp. OK268]|uniref:CBASS oligonucleotide cyclase n=1 Tax=Mucilaginibacter sp. OK268 TaxID=1881048 RepID=UPI0008886785|nr:CBASS oligonucleotide cyclase [Mucilaginibacter sp. OK268]SDP99721.1 Nucleotidyltransferase domain-containing protein [Mucilaginibacter sp. OK268]
MAREHVGHNEIAQFAKDRVNLPKDKADEYRAQAGRVREKVTGYLNDHPDFSLKKILLSGSLAKGTALRTINDIDMACYISGSEAPKDISALITYLAEKLRNAFPNLSPDQVQPKTYSVTISFRGSGLDVDVVPILYFGDKDWYGCVVSQDDGSLLETCIPRHLDFIRSRKQKQETHFAQVIRLAKYWVRLMKTERSGFRFKSFMVELVMSKLLDKGVDFSDYPEALQSFFTYLATSNLDELIVFYDYYKASDVPVFTNPIKVIDPVNPKNNAAKLYPRAQADEIVDAAIDAGDAIDSALSATTKEKTVYYWQKVFGTTFNV